MMQWLVSKISLLKHTIFQGDINSPPWLAALPRDVSIHFAAKGAVSPAAPWPSQPPNDGRKYHPLSSLFEKFHYGRSRAFFSPAWTSSKIFSKECLNTQPAKKRQFRTGASNMQPHGPSGRLNGDPPKYITQNLSSRMNAPFLNISSRSRILTINRENTLKSKHTTLTIKRALTARPSFWPAGDSHIIMSSSVIRISMTHLAGRVPMAFRSTRRASNRLNLQVLPLPWGLWCLLFELFSWKKNVDSTDTQTQSVKVSELCFCISTLDRAARHQGTLIRQKDLWCKQRNALNSWTRWHWSRWGLETNVKSWRI